MSNSAKRQDRSLNLVVGSFTLLIFALLAIAFSLSTRKDLLDTRDEYYIYSYYNDIGLLEKGAPVKYSGVNIGRVISVTLLPNQRIRVECELTMIKRIPTDSLLSVAATAVSGDTYLNLLFGHDTSYLPHADTIEDAPTLKGLNYLDIQSISSIFDDTKGIATELFSNIRSIFGTDSYTREQLSQALASITTLKKEFTAITNEGGKITHNIQLVKDSISKITSGIKSCTNNIFSSLPPAKIKADFSKIKSSFSQVKDVIDTTLNNKSFASIKSDFSTLNTWASSLNMSPNSVVGIMLSKDCGGITQTISKVGDSVKTAQDFSLFKKLGFYLDGKELLSNFENRTNAQYLPASAYMSRWSTFSFNRYRYSCNLPSGVKSCPPSLK